MAPTLSCPIPQSEIQALLRRMGAAGCYAGFQNAVLAVELLLEEPDRIHYLVKGVYAEIADETDATISSVERSLRTMVSRMWRDTDHAILEEVAGHRLLKPPTNGEFLDMTAHYLREAQ